MADERVRLDQIAGLEVAELLRQLTAQGEEISCLRIEQQDRLAGALVVLSGEDTSRYLAALMDRAIDIGLERRRQAIAPAATRTAEETSMDNEKLTAIGFTPDQLEGLCCPCGCGDVDAIYFARIDRVQIACSYCGHKSLPHEDPATALREFGDLTRLPRVTRTIRRLRLGKAAG